jgi:hypothetical protein
MISVGYNTAKDSSRILNPAQVIFIAMIWPLALPFMVGAYLGDK